MDITKKVISGDSETQSFDFSYQGEEFVFKVNARKWGKPKY